MTTSFVDEPEDIKDIFKKEKTNFLLSRPPQPLTTCLCAVYSDILGSCKKPKKMKKNLSQNEHEAITALTKAQTEGHI